MPTLYLIRHAHAGDRVQWPADDRERPLSEKGWHQARNLARALGDVPVGRVLTSPAVRCAQTVQPLAEHHAIDLEERRELREGADPVKLIALMEELAPATPALCSHGDVIPEVVELLLRRGMAIEGPAGNNKGSWWALHHDGEGFTTARWHPPA